MLSAQAEYVGKGRQQVHAKYYSTTVLISVQKDAMQHADAVHRVCAIHKLKQGARTGNKPEINESR